jgi:glycerol-3-phosphate responsive antiterminator
MDVCKITGLICLKRHVCRLQKNISLVQKKKILDVKVDLIDGINQILTNGNKKAVY